MDKFASLRESLTDPFFQFLTKYNAQFAPFSIEQFCPKIFTSSADFFTVVLLTRYKMYSTRDSPLIPPVFS